MMESRKLFLAHDSWLEGQQMRWNLATKFSVTILGVVVVAFLSSLVTWYAAWRVERRLEEAGRENLPAVLAEEVEIVLFEGNHLIASQLLDEGNPQWEEEFRTLKPRFQDWIATVRTTIPVSGEEKTLLQLEEEKALLQLEETWSKLDSRREDVIALGKKGETERARTILLTEVGRLSMEARDLCRQLIDIHEKASRDSIKRAGWRMREITWVVGVSSVLTFLLGGFLLWLFFYRVLFPLRGMVADAQLYRGDRHVGDKGPEEDELRIMGNYLRNLMSDVSDTRSRLQRSRDRLLVAEKLASVGRLAAGVAHEIRNPLTAMKMWLFSIQEAVQGNAELRRKLGVVAEEIARLESIVRDFLEFSRPSPLHRQPQDVGGVLDQTLELLGPRFQGEKIMIVYTPRPALPPVMVDAAQLKQVLLNLLGNAADAMAGGGEIRITSNAEKDADGRPMVVVRISDAGPGMPQDIQCRIFEPFFTTKENGTGLGLCIAAQVMARHGGGLVLESSTDKGTTFAIWMPVAPEQAHGQDSRS
jgi:signal transduction histidine kinase